MVIRWIILISLQYAIDGLSIGVRSTTYNLLVEHSGSRRKELQPSGLPRTAEAFVNGRVRLVQLLEINPKRQCVVKMLQHNSKDDAVQKIDFSQLVTIWRDDHDGKSLVLASGNHPTKDTAEEAFHALYQSHVGRGRKITLTKKKMAALQEDSNSQALRMVMKAGDRMSRLVDSCDAADLLFGPNHGPSQRAAAAQMLGEEATLGGRFKRFPCIWIADDDSFVNGGWLVVDHSNRAGAEARKLVGRQGKVQSASDIRIVRRLECFALGEQLQLNEQQQRSGSNNIEVDVRETLKALDLPVTSRGATDALVGIGIWSKSAESRKGYAEAIRPWPPEILEASRHYQQMIQNNTHGHEKRLDLTLLPCFSIDRRQTRFRDDAIGIRSRASTGRRILNEYSKWEVLIHVADVSDLYTTPNRWRDADDLRALSCLGEAAMRRGTSRYDLAQGPLHLLPPTVLHQLTLDESRRSVTIWAYIDERSGKIMDSGIERTTISSPVPFSYEEATSIMLANNKEDNFHPLLAVTARILSKWNIRYQSRNEGARKRSNRMNAKMDLSRSRAHLLVDQALDLYTHAASGLLWRADAPVPRSLGAATSRGGRLGTGPLRRAIDGQAQRQLLAVCCNFGKPLTLAECKDISRRAIEPANAIANVRLFRK